MFQGVLGSWRWPQKKLKVLIGGDDDARWHATRIGRNKWRVSPFLFPCPRRTDGGEIPSGRRIFRAPVPKRIT
jgi:hypothetical protein